MSDAAETSSRQGAGNDRSGRATPPAERILALVRAIPPGWVRTYGDLSPSAPRLAGRVLRDCGDPSVPWWRVVRADGALTQGERQRERLADEGVAFRGARVDLADARLPLPPGAD